MRRRPWSVALGPPRPSFEVGVVTGAIRLRPDREPPEPDAFGAGLTVVGSAPEGGVTRHVNPAPNRAARSRYRVG